MSKQYQIVVGTAQEVSLEVSRLQNEGWKVRDGQPVLVQSTQSIVEGQIKMVEPIFAQSIIRTMTDEEELFAGTKAEAMAPDSP